MKVVICGMGIAGLCVAYALTKLGVEPVVIGADHGSTASGAGIVSAQFWDGELAPYARRSQEILSGLVEVNRCGMTQIALSPETAALLAKIEGVCAGLPRALESELSGRLRERIVGATYSEHDFWVDNHALLNALEAGSRLVRARILETGEGFVRTDCGEFQADCLVLAMGAGMDDAIERRASRLARSGARLSSMFHILDSGVYARPDAGGLIAGDGDELWTDPDVPATVTPDFLAHLEKELGEILPPGRADRRRRRTAFIHRLQTPNCTSGRQELARPRFRRRRTGACAGYGGTGGAIHRRRQDRDLFLSTYQRPPSL